MPKTFPSFLPAWNGLPENPERYKKFFDETLASMVDGVNQREVAIYYLTEALNGQLWFYPDDTKRQRNGFRTVVNIGTLPDGVGDPWPRTVPHGIEDVDTQFIVTRLYGTASDTTARTYIPIPYIDVAGGMDIDLNMDSSNIIINGTGDRSNYNICYVVVDYLRN